MRKTILSLILMLQVLMSSLSAQSNYPVYVTPVLMPPYSLKLSDYSSFGSQKLMLTISVNDLNISNLPVKLHIKLETAGVTIETPPTLQTTPIYLNGGETSVLFGEDLFDYFNINNLTFKGYSKQTYQRTGQLPEGFYKFTVEVLHFATNRVISNKGTASAWIAIGKPPVLRSPDNGANLGQYVGMPLTFSWLASNVGSPVSVGSIQYRFEMWEMRVPGINANTVVASMPVFHDNTSYNTNYSLYPATLMMEPGMTYAWRVTAFDGSGFVPFEQDGHSQVRTFTYKALCDTVKGFTATARGRNGKFSWEPGIGHTSFNIEMRNPQTGWFSASETFDSKAEFFDLDYGSTLQMRVQAVCNGDATSTSDFTSWHSLTIPVQKPMVDTLSCPNCGCDDNLPNTEITNFTLRDNLTPGDTIANKTGTTRFIVKSAEPQGNDTYKGIFLYWAEIWNLKFVCEYRDLQVNTDNVIVNMDFESVYNPQFLLDVDAAAAYLNGLADNIAIATTSTAIKDTLAVNQSFDAIYVNKGDSLMAVSVDANGKVVETVLAATTDNLGKTLVKGADGQEYVVTNDGQVMGVKEYQATGGNSRLINNHNEQKEANNLSAATTISFSAASGQKYGFDAYADIKTNIQTQYPALTNGYQPAYKSVASFASDRVGVSRTNGITFKDEMGIPAIATGSDLTIRGSAAGSTVGLYAYRAVNDTTDEIVGKLNILSFDEQPKRLIVVPVNGYNFPPNYLPDLQNRLNAIYAQAITRWSVSPGDAITVNFPDGVMTHGGSSAYEAYNDDQKLVINAYADHNGGNLDDDALYLFYIDKVDGKAGVAGFMPLQRQCGFIYGSPELNIVAHELGHGAFNLYHTFSPDSYIAAEQTTQNLMDYNGGTELWKYQWDLIHDPEGIALAFLQDESEGAMVNGSLDALTQKVVDKAKDLTYLYGNVYAIIHSFSIEEQKEDVIIDLAKSISTDGPYPICLQGCYSETVSKVKTFTIILYFKFSEGELKNFKSKQGAFELFEELSTYIKATHSQTLPFLAVVTPDNDNNYRNCSAFAGNLDHLARISVINNDYENYYTQLLTIIDKCSQNGNVLLFVNGYRPYPDYETMTMEKPDTDNSITENDRYGYWQGIDRQFIEKLKPKSCQIWYADGHHSVSTSNHGSIPAFASSMYSCSSELVRVAIFAKFPNVVTGTYAALGCYHNTDKNADGFYKRYRNGVLAGAEMLKKIQYNISLNEKGEITDTLDVVCHSMGYAYALGIIEVLRSKIPFGRLYIIAPENPTQGTINRTEWTDVWQYGSNEDNDPIDVQDGVAQQGPVGGISDRRAYIPASVPRGFLESHSIGNYNWIFDIVNPLIPGYVKPRE